MRRGIGVVAFERRLEDVVGVIVERLIRVDQRSRCRLDLQRAERAGAERGGQRRARSARRTGVGIDVGGREIARTLIDRIGLLIAERQDGIALVLGEVRTERQVAAEVTAIAAPGDLVGGRRLDTLEIVARDEVDDAGDRIGTVGGGRAAGQRIDPLDQRERNVVEIDAAIEIGRRDAVAVEQHDVAEVAEPAQIDIEGARTTIVHRRTNVRHGTRQRTQDFLRGIGLPQPDFVLADDLHRRRADDVGIADKRAGDDDVVIIARRFGRVVLRLRGGGALGEGRRARADHTDQRRGQEIVTDACRHGEPLMAFAKAMISACPLQGGAPIFVGMSHERNAHVVDPKAL